MKKVALITGISGQDGSFMAELLLEKGYEVHGIIRRSSSFNLQRLDNFIAGPIQLHYGDMTDSLSMTMLISKIRPDEIYNLAAMSEVGVSFEIPEYVANVNAIGILRILEAVRLLGLENKTKVYQASTSELFGKVVQTPQTEKTPFYPRSPYGISKLYAYWITKNYREAYNIFAVNGVAFNHESERRGENFVTRKISLAVARIKHGFQDKLYLGNLEAKRDWGYAKDYVECMWLMLQQKEPEDFIIATGETHSVREFVTRAFKEAGIELKWQGVGIDEKAFDAESNKVLVEVDPKFFRPTETDTLVGDSTKAINSLGWNPVKTSFNELVRIMVVNDIDLVEREELTCK